VNILSIIKTTKRDIIAIAHSTLVACDKNSQSTVKPVILAALNFGSSVCYIILAFLILTFLLAKVSNIFKIAFKYLRPGIFTSHQGHNIRETNTGFTVISLQ